MNKNKTNHSERKSEKKERIRATRKAILEYSNKIMEENKLNPDQQMAMLLFVTIEKCMDSMGLLSFSSGCLAVSILLKELLNENLEFIGHETNKRNKK